MQFKQAAEGTDMPAIGLGTWQLRGQEATDAVRQALETGYRHIDTARMYGNEEAVGKGIADSSVDREDVFLTTKVWRDHLEPDALVDEAHAALDALGTEYVDQLLIHWPNEDVPLADSLEALDGLREEGVARSIGVSNFTEGLVHDALDIVDTIAVDQVEMHVYNQQQELRKCLDDNGLILTAYSPLARGRVTEDPLLREIGEEHDRTAAQVALRWLIQQDNVVAIPKTGDQHHQQQNLGAMEFELTGEDMDRIRGLDRGQKLVDPEFAPWRS